MDSLVGAVLCVRCELVPMSPELTSLLFWLLCLKVFADAMGWTQ